MLHQQEMQSGPEAWLQPHKFSGTAVQQYKYHAGDIASNLEQASLAGFEGRWRTFCSLWVRVVSFGTAPAALCQTGLWVQCSAECIWREHLQPVSAAAAP